MSESRPKLDRMRGGLMQLHPRRDPSFCTLHAHDAGGREEDSSDLRLHEHRRSRAGVLLMGSECRLREIGPSFGTKFLYFLGGRRVKPMPLILDSVGWETPGLRGCLLPIQEVGA